MCSIQHFKKVAQALTSVAQLVVVSSRPPKGGGLDSHSGHIPRFHVQSPGQGM